MTMKNTFTLLFFFLTLVACDSFKNKPKENGVVKIEYVNSKNVTIRQISGAIKTPFNNISITYGSTNENDEEANILTVKVKNYQDAMASNAIAYANSKVILEVLKKEVTNVGDFDTIYVNFFTEEAIKDLDVWRKNEISFIVKQ